MKDSTKILSAFALMAMVGTMGFSAIASAAITDAPSEDDEMFAQCQAYMQEHRAQHMGEGKQAQMEEIKIAIQSDDYATWYELHVELEGPGQNMIEVITEDNFYLLGDMMDARESGDHETAKEIADELGLERGHGHGHIEKGSK